ncbi:hypothetical protein Pfo_007477 [Paulownia fortunei]|nr:hypothetical protein Pfo_007477 [Paulownia fortunei]
MAFQGNTFALLGGHDGDDVENLLARVAASAAKAEEPPSAVEKRPSKSKKPLASSPRSEKGRDQGHGSERHSRNGVERYNGQGKGSWQNHHGRSSNGYRQDKRPADGSKLHEVQGNGYQKDEKQTDGNVWQRTGRPNGDERNNTNVISHGSSGCEVDDHLQAPSPGDMEVRERGYGWRREFKGDYDSEREVKVFEDKRHYESKGQERVSGGIMEELTRVNGYKDDKENRFRNRNSGGYGDYRGYGHGGAGEGKGGGERRGNRGGYQGYRHASAAEGKDDGKTSESMEVLHGKGVQKDKSETNAGSFVGDILGKKDSTLFYLDDAVTAEAPKESDSKKGRHHEVLSQEEAEGLAEEQLEAKRMTLHEYEKQLQQNRKVLESLKMKERKVTPDKDFESMQTVERKNVESSLVKLNSDNDKLKKKFTLDKDDNNVHNPLVTNFKPAGTNYSGRGVLSGQRGGYSRSVKKADAPPSFQDAKQFPALGGSTKA